jgi:hypothetical protein
MITCQLQGGLGNQLFQIFTALSYSLSNNISILFDDALETTPYTSSEGPFMRNTYWSTLLVHLMNLTTFSLPPHGKIDVQSFFPFQEPRYEFTELPSEIATRNMKLVGYYQSFRYFDKNKKYLFRLMKLESLRNMVMNVYGSELGFSEDKISISMHFRLGDYLTLADIHPPLKIDYYKRALQYILRHLPSSSVQVFCFAQAEDWKTVSIQIQVLQKMFPEVSFTPVPDHIADWEQMLIMSCCHHHIIANSTFSWWGAYFNPSLTKIVTFPETWFGSACSHSTRDLCPPAWTSI